MGESAKDVVMHDIKKGVLLDIFKKGERMDGRGFEDYRPISVKKGVIATAEGSALAKIGKTQILVGAKFDAVTPFADRPNEGVFSVNCEFLPLASPTFEPGPPNENSIQLARVTDRGIRSAEVEGDSPITANFFLEEGKVLALYLDIYVLDHSGNMTDAASLAAMGALMSAKIPKYSEGKLVRTESIGGLPLKHFPISTTIAKIDKYLLVDPSKEENLVADSTLTITTTQTGLLASMQKTKGAMSRDEVLQAVDIAFKKGDELRKYIL
ncbi:MAG: exosome complex protein Rrp42 [Candidatus Micrarchaeia archaeon]